MSRREDGELGDDGSTAKTELSLIPTDLGSSFHLDVSLLLRRPSLPRF